jgi:hypothetical protein
MSRVEAVANQVVMGAAKGDAKMTTMLFNVLKRFNSENLQPITEIRLTETEMLVC